MTEFFDKIFSIDFEALKDIEANEVIAAVAEYLEKFFAELFKKIA